MLCPPTALYPAERDVVTMIRLICFEPSFKTPIIAAYIHGHGRDTFTIMCNVVYQVDDVIASAIGALEVLVGEVNFVALSVSLYR